MPKVKNKTEELEILIATINRTSLDFLISMFSELNYLDYNILIINQTTSDKILESVNPNIRVINSFERGLSNSRNLALEHAKHPICLITDDDVVFLNDFENKIIEAHRNHKQSIITFQTVTTNNKLYWKYPSNSRLHNDYIRQKTLSIEISFKREDIGKLKFDNRFGLGAKFEDGENNIFLNEAKKQGFDAWFMKESVSKHAPLSSSDEVESDRIIYAKAAIHAYRYGNLAYFWVLKFVFFLVRKKYISLHEINAKLKLGFKAIQDFKKDKPNE